jgi:hypothetical protein
VLAALAKDDFRPRETAWLSAADASPLHANPEWSRQPSAADDIIELRRTAARAATAESGGAPPIAEEPGARDTVLLTREGSDELCFRVTGAGGLLVQTDAWYPGWIATVDGVEVPLLRVNHGLRGVGGPAGDREVRFHYAPQPFRLGLRLAGGAAVLLLLAAAKVGRANVPRK